MKRDGVAQNRRNQTQPAAGACAKYARMLATQKLDERFRGKECGRHWLKSATVMALKVSALPEKRGN